MIYVEIVLAALKAIPLLVEAIGSLIVKVEESNEIKRKHLLEVKFNNDLYAVKTKGDNRELEALLGKRFPPKP